MYYIIIQFRVKKYSKDCISEVGKDSIFLSCVRMI
jgi:hypothetical protein